MKSAWSSKSFEHKFGDKESAWEGGGVIVVFVIPHMS